MIDILIPTRKRTGRLFQTIVSIFAHSISKQFRIYVYVDDDDEETKRIAKDTNHIKFHIGKQKVLSECWNDLYKLGCGDILFHGADDIIFETFGWDVIVEDHFKQYPESLYYCRDGHQDENCPTHSFTSRSAADKIGYFVPPYFEADWNDVWLKMLYRDRLYYNPEMMIRHNHVNVDAKYDDEIYEIARERRKRAALVWEEKKNLIHEDINKLCV